MKILLLLNCETWDIGSWFDDAVFTSSKAFESSFNLLINILSALSEALSYDFLNDSIYKIKKMKEIILDFKKKYWAIN